MDASGQALSTSHPLVGCCCFVKSGRWEFCGIKWPVADAGSTRCALDYDASNIFLCCVRYEAGILAAPSPSRGSGPALVCAFLLLLAGFSAVSSHSSKNMPLDWRL